jgi:spore maturation protein CgeB
MQILYIGADHPSTTSRHRADALRRLGCDVYVVNPQKLIGSRNRLQAWLDYRTGYRLFQRKLRLSLVAALPHKTYSPDLIWVDSGELIGPRILRLLLSIYNAPAILFNVDDPTGRRDGNRFLLVRSSLPLYNLCVSCRFETSLEFMALGALRSVVVSRSYDESIHNPSPLVLPAQAEKRVSFVGTFIPGENRDQFLLALARPANLPLVIYGNRWPRSRLFDKLKRFYYGPALSGDAYLKAINTPAVSLGFLSHGNRDLVTQRSFETPACGGLFCAERTSEHQLLFEDGVEVVFWDSVDECIQVCRSLLRDVQTNRAIRNAGQQHMLAAGFGNEDICRQVLNSI